MNVLINYASPSFAAVRRLNSDTAIRMGGFDRVVEYSPDDLDAEFRHRNDHILGQALGAGYWLWKPYIIERTLQSLRDEDFLFYSDAGSFFTGSVAPLVAVMQRTQQDVIAFRLKRGLEAEHTKRDAFVLLDCDESRYADTPQVESGYSLWRKTPFSMMLVAEWLHYAEDERIVTDAPNRCGLPNLPGFREHRWEQSIWSLLCKKHGVALHRQPWRPAADHDGFPHSTYPDFMVPRMRSPRALARWFLRHPEQVRLHAPVLRTIARTVRDRLLGPFRSRLGRN